MKQTIDITGYKATGLTALLTWYTRDSGAQAIGTIRALDASDVAIGATASSAAITGPAGVWLRSELTKVLPAGTAKVEAGVEANASGAVEIDGISLKVGQMSSELLSGPSFDSGTYGDSWDNVTNSFVDVAGGYARNDSGDFFVQGGAFASSEIKQEVAIPAGYEYGDAVLEFARANEFADDGTVTLEVLDGGGAVLESSTTGAETIASGWERRRLIVTLPDGAATLRVRLIATRALSAGNSGALFDDVSLRIHKDLDPAFERDLDFTEPHHAVMPRSFEEAYLAWPTLAIPAVWNGSDALPSVRASKYNASATGAWSDAVDGIPHPPAKFLGHWMHDEAALSVDAYRFTRGSTADLQIDGYGAFAKADVFSVAVCFRVTERTMSLACGLVGNKDADGLGWGLSLDTSGRVVATVNGSTPRTATGAVDHRDGAAHWALLTWDGSTLRIVDAAGSSTNASDPGEFSSTAVMRIGRDGANGVIGGVDIARVLLWDGDAIDAADFASIVDTIGDDPNGLVTWSSSQPVWIDGDDDEDGATLVRAAARHVPVGYSGGYGLSIGAACTNLALSTDYATGSHCGPEANVTLTQGIIDPTGLARGVRVANTVNDFGYRLTDIPLPDENVRVIFWARTIDGTEQNLKVRIIDSDENDEDNDVIVIDSSWQRIERLLAWTAPTPTGHLRFTIHDNSPAAFDLAGVVWVGQGHVPTAYQDANTAVGDRHGVASETLPIQLHYEGEIEVEGLVTTQMHGSYLASVDNDTTDQKNQRALLISSSEAVAVLWDNAGSPTSIPEAPSWASDVKLRCRWNKLEIPDAPIGRQLGVGIDDTTVDSTAVAFTVSTAVPSEKIRLGGGSPNGSTSPHALLRHVVVRAREEKLL